MPQGAMCPTHNTNWFKTDRMRSFAHPIGDTGRWCNQTDVEQPQGEIREAPRPSIVSGSKTVRYGRTFNLGNYESSRMEIEQQFPSEMSDMECFRELHQRLAVTRRLMTQAANGDAAKEAALATEAPPLEEDDTAPF